jgi:23S rRNA pseudouridine2605 synthase
MTIAKPTPDDGTPPPDDTPAPPQPVSPQQVAEAGGAERIAKRLARAGLCSRRDAERWIAEGRVAVNGTVLTTPAVTVSPADRIVVDGNPLPELEPTRLWRYHKPDGLVTTARDEKGRQTVFQALPPEMPRVVSVGRLDLTTEGLLLLTNDGELARFLELPLTGWARRYRVRVNGIVDPTRLAGLARGVAIDGIQYGPIEAVLDRQQGSNAWLTITLREGKNREVRNVMESLGLTVNRLIRIAYGPFQLGKLERGEIEEVPKRVLHDQVATFFADRGDKPLEPNMGTAKAKEPNTGTAKAKPKPKPRFAAGAKPVGAKPAGSHPRPAGPGPAGKHETRRR